MGRWEVEVRDRTGIGSGDPLFLHILSLGKRMGDSLVWGDFYFGLAL